MIQGKNIILRTVRESDLEEMFARASDLQEKGYYWPMALPSKPKYLKRYQETGLWDVDFGTLLITAKDWRLIGEIGFFKGMWYQEGFEVGYHIYREADRGKGYTSEALSLFTAYLFAAKPIPRLQINVSKGNAASRRVAEKCGYRYEGTMRKAVFNRGRYHDLELFSILRGEEPMLEQVSQLGE